MRQVVHGVPLFQLGEPANFNEALNVFLKMDCTTARLRDRKTDTFATHASI